MQNFVELTKTDIIGTALEVFDIESQSILNLKDKVAEDFVKAIDLIYESKGKVVVTGMGKSGLIGRKIASTFCSTGTPAVYLHPAESTHGDSGIISKNDVVIALSNSGETAELLNLLPLIARFNVPMIALVGNLNSTLAQKSEAVLDISVEKEACPLNKAPTASTTATLAMGDALAVCLLKKRGFSYEDFLTYHPSGALGKGILYEASELMSTGVDLPIINMDVKFSEVLSFITQKALGCALLVDNNNTLCGIITDGDIRRIVLAHNDALNMQAKDVMGKNPKTINPNTLCAKALAMMEKSSITSLAVVDENNHPVGLLHIQDLLKAGVV